MYRYAKPEERTAAGARIDPATADVWFVYAETINPYGDLEALPEYDQVGREFFAADPMEGIAVLFDDLPGVTARALEGKRRAADREGWAQLLSLPGHA